MTTLCLRGSALLFGGALVFAGLTPSASAQPTTGFIFDDTAPYNAVWVSGDDFCPPPYDDYLQCGKSVELFGDVPFLDLPSQSSFKTEETRLFFTSEQPDRVALVQVPDTGSAPDDAFVFDRAYATLTFTVGGDQTIEYDFNFGMASLLTIAGETFVGGPRSGTVDLEAGESIVIGGWGTGLEQASFSFDIVRPGCNLADNAAPFGQHDLADIDGFLDAYFGDIDFFIADVAEPYGIYDLSDFDVFIGQFLAGCP
ncbi:MAG: hypothetical protein AAF297_11580 [Planctomycetota bacterium]